MKPYKEIRRLIKRNEDILQIVLPQETYQGLLQTYLEGTHHLPCEGKQRKDLRYLQSVLKVK